MDLSDAQQWKDAVQVIWSAPQVVVPLLILVAGFAYWFGNRNGSAGKAGIEEQKNAVKEQIIPTA